MDTSHEIVENHPVIFFDGVCNLCNSSVNFIIDRDPKKTFRFSSLQSEYAKKNLLPNFGGQNQPDSIVLKRKGRIYIKSSAALRVAAKMPGLWPLLMIFWIIPKPLRDAIYDLVARNRYKWFGKKDACRIPSPELRERFLES